MKLNDKTTRELIIKAVKADKRCADNDKLLIAKIWYLKGWKDTELYNHIKDMPSSETIRRTRAKLVEEGIIEPSEKAKNARKAEAKQARRDLGYNG